MHITRYSTFIGTAVLLLIAFTMTACHQAPHTTYSARPVPTDSTWVLLPVTNFSQTPLAGKRTESILSTLLRAKGVLLYTQVSVEEEGSDSLLLPAHPGAEYEQALDWAKKQGFRYAITGAVEEWRYKTGLDAEPAVSFSLRVVDIQNGTVFWTASGADTGWPRQGVAALGHDLLASLLQSLELN